MKKSYRVYEKTRQKYYIILQYITLRKSLGDKSPKHFPIKERREPKVEKEQYRLTISNIDKYNKVKGIYALIYKDEIIYIGQSKSIGDRLKDHRSTKPQEIVKKIIREQGQCNRCKSLAMYDFIQNNIDEINFAVLKETDELNYYEEYYITKYKPKYNYRGVDIPFYWNNKQSWK